MTLGHEQFTGEDPTQRGRALAGVNANQKMCSLTVRYFFGFLRNSVKNSFRD